MGIVDNLIFGIIFIVSSILCFETYETSYLLIAIISILLIKFDKD